jgi:hypothetical protein
VGKTMGFQARSRQGAQKGGPKMTPFWGTPGEGISEVCNIHTTDIHHREGVICGIHPPISGYAYHTSVYPGVSGDTLDTPYPDIGVFGGYPRIPPNTPFWGVLQNTLIIQVANRP